MRGVFIDLNVWVLRGYSWFIGMTKGWEIHKGKNQMTFIR